MTAANEQVAEPIKHLAILGDAPFETGLEPAYHNRLVEHYEPIVRHLPDLLAGAETVVVTGEDDVAGMARARETRLAIKRTRNDLERGRKDLKNLPLTLGRAIDGMAAAVGELIAPVETALRDKEDVVRLAEERRLEELRQERWEKLEAVSFQCEFDLGTMSQENFADLLEVATLADEAKQRKAKEAAAAEAEAEQERIKWQAVEDKRLADERAEFERIEKENAELRRQADERERAAAAERERLAEAQRQADAEAAAKLEAEQQAEAARLAAPDADKLERLELAICSLEMPDVSGAAAHSTLNNAKRGLNDAVSALRVGITDLRLTTNGGE